MLGYRGVMRMYTICTLLPLSRVMDLYDTCMALCGVTCTCMSLHSRPSSSNLETIIDPDPPRKVRSIPILAHVSQGSMETQWISGQDVDRYTPSFLFSAVRQKFQNSN